MKSVSGIILCVCIVLLCSAVTAEQQLNPQIKSILYPGWGQLSNGHTLKGAVFMSLETAALGLATYHSVRGQRFYRKYHDTGDSFEADMFRRETTRHDKRRNLYIGIGLLVWAVNIWDMYYVSKPAFDTPVSSGRTAFSVQFGGEGQVQLTCSVFL
jgi:hypothetical protein